MTVVPDSALVLVGVSHESAGLDVRQRCAVEKTGLEAALRELRDRSGVDEVCIVSTCNRTEVLLIGPDASVLEATARETRFSGVDSEIYVHHGAAAVFHLFGVCSGLHSMVLGESEIQAQVKEALGAAQAAGTTGPWMESLFQHALKTGKRVRTETAISSGNVSVASAAVDLIARVHGRFNRVSALIVGAGETGVRVGTHLRARGIGRLTFTNRTLARAEAAARDLGAEVVPFDALAPEIDRHDVVVACVEAERPVIDKALLDGARVRRGDVPKVFIDVSVPRAVAVDVRDWKGDGMLFDLDALDAVVARNRDARKAELGKVDAILLEETRKHLGVRAYAAMAPALTSLGDRFEEIRLEWLAKRGAGTDIDAASRDLANRLLAVALASVKEGARLMTSVEAVRKTLRGQSWKETP